MSDTPHDCTELLWRQTQQMRALAEHHHRQLTDNLDSLPVTDNGPAAIVPTPEKTHPSCPRRCHAVRGH